MIPELQGLSQEEQNLMADALPMIAILVAGADGKIDEEEKKWAAKVMDMRTWEHPNNEITGAFYTKAQEGYKEGFERINKSLNGNLTERNEMLSGHLSALNKVIPKLPGKFGKAYYEGLKSFAEHIAKASGGFMGFMSVGPEEKKWIELPMLDQFEFIIEDEEE